MSRHSYGSFVRIREDDFNNVENWIRAEETASRNVQYGANVLAMLMARTNQAFAMEMSRGPYDPQKRFPAWAWRTPSQGIRRITQRYYRGWKVMRITPSRWALVNATREAWFIEYGINWVGSSREITGRNAPRFLRHSRRIRRPVQKLSLMKTMRFIDTTDAAGRVWSMIYAPFRPGRTINTRGEAFIADRVQAQMGMRYI